MWYDRVSNEGLRSNNDAMWNDEQKMYEKDDEMWHDEQYMRPNDDKINVTNERYDGMRYDAM